MYARVQLIIVEMGRHDGKIDLDLYKWTAEGKGLKRKGWVVRQFVKKWTQTAASM